MRHHLVDPSSGHWALRQHATHSFSPFQSFSLHVSFFCFLLVHETDCCSAAAFSRGQTCMAMSRLMIPIASIHPSGERRGTTWSKQDKQPSTQTKGPRKTQWEHGDSTSSLPGDLNPLTFSWWGNIANHCTSVPSYFPFIAYLRNAVQFLDTTHPPSWLKSRAN